MTINEHAVGTEHPELVNTLNDLATLLRAERREGKAEALYRRYLSIL